MHKITSSSGLTSYPNRYLANRIVLNRTEKFIMLSKTDCKLNCCDGENCTQKIYSIQHNRILYIQTTQGHCYTKIRE